MRTGFQKHDHNWSQTFRGVKQAANYKRLLPTMVGVLINETWTRRKTKSISPIQATLAQRVVYNLQKHSVSPTVWQKYVKIIIHRMVQKMLRKTVRNHRFWHPQNGTHQRRCVPSGTASQGAECMVNPLLPERRAFSRPLARMAWTSRGYGWFKAHQCVAHKIPKWVCLQIHRLSQSNPVDWIISFSPLKYHYWGVYMGMSKHRVYSPCLSPSLFQIMEK